MFTKLFSSITTSSIWNENNNTRIVWITMLAMANKNGYVAASVGGLAHEARVSREDCEKALDVLSSPDTDSRSKEFEGRRVEIVDGGFQLLNYSKYRSMRSEEERKEYMKNYMVEYRKLNKVNKNVNNVSECKPPLAQAEAEEIRGEENKIALSAMPPKQKTRIKLSDEDFIRELSKLYPRSLIDSEMIKMKAWLLTPKARGRRLTQSFVTSWMSRSEIPMALNSKEEDKEYKGGYYADDI